VNSEHVAGPSSAARGLPRPDETVRCSSCGGLLAPDAEWCGQCFAPVRKAEPVAIPEPPSPTAPDAAGAGATRASVSSAVATPGGGGVEVVGGTASWDCPVCQARNSIEASECAVCQTPFARLFQSPEDQPSIEPRTAALWSLGFAGLGHWRAGLRAEGVARMILFAWTLGTVLVILVSRSGGGFGAAGSLFALYVISAVAIYALSAVDAYRTAAGMPALVPSRMLLWSSAVLILLSIALATFVTMPAARG
jgi:hypothetical protein